MKFQEYRNTGKLKMSSYLKIIDLFAGIGGTRLGFERAGLENIQCVFTSEWDKYSVQTYKANFGEDYIHGDITKIATKDIPNHDILLAGFPCQPFSQAGLKKGFSDKISPQMFDEIYKTAVKNGAVGGKLMGAGGSGFFYFLAPPQKHEKIKKALPEVRVWVPLRFANKGSSFVTRIS